MTWIGFLLLLMLLHHCFAMAGKSLLIFGGILCLQYWILPAAPGMGCYQLLYFCQLCPPDDALPDDRLSDASPDAYALFGGWNAEDPFSLRG